MIKAVTDLEVFNLSYNFAMDIFKIAKSFPKSRNIFSNRPDYKILSFYFSKYCGRLGKKDL